MNGTSKSDVALISVFERRISVCISRPPALLHRRWYPASIFDNKCLNVCWLNMDRRGGQKRSNRTVKTFHMLSDNRFHWQAKNQRSAEPSLVWRKQYAVSEDHFMSWNLVGTPSFIICVLYLEDGDAAAEAPIKLNKGERRNSGTSPSRIRMITGVCIESMGMQHAWEQWEMN
jgi:hypothetical protein